MPHSALLLAEFQQEAANTRRLLATVPFDKMDYKPHEKSMTLKALTLHVATIAGWWKECLVKDELDFSIKGEPQPEITNTEELLARFDFLVDSSSKMIEASTEDEYAKPWTMRNGEQIYFTMPKKEVTRTWCLNHWYHHRGQLTVYLRLLNVPLVGMYGPTADDVAGM
jgi:uncharacterized damage-inducible protein DinB